MKKLIIEADSTAGFAAHSAEDGQSVAIVQSASVTADDPLFYLYINQIERTYLAPAGFEGGGCSFLVVQHRDNSADVYMDYRAVISGMPTRQDISAGDPVMVEDIKEIVSYRIPQITIEPTDRIACVIQSGWKFGLFFDFSRSPRSEEEVWSKLGALANDLHGARVVKNLQLRLLEGRKPFLLAEGKTDIALLRAAQMNLAPDLPLGYFEPGNQFGDGALFAICEQLARYGPPNRNKVIAVFDRDNPKMLRRLSRIGPLDDYQSWGNNVYSFALPVPRHRDPEQGLPIEFLFTDSDLVRTAPNGKRLYFEEEIERLDRSDEIPLFVVRSGLANPTGSRISDKPAGRIVDDAGEQVAISKSHFAAYVLEGIGEFSDVDFKGFSGVFQMIKKILRSDVVAF